MWPVLLSFGSFQVQTLWVVLVCAVLAMGYVIWRKASEEHYELFTFFDMFILSTLVGVFVGRAAYVLFHFEQFGWDAVSWLAFATRPGISFAGWCIGAFLVVRAWARHHRWGFFTVLDYWVLALSLGQVFLWIGLFLSGGEVGFAAVLPYLGLRFPGVIEPRYPVQLVALLISLGLFRFLSWSENHYRHFVWYRHQRHSAQPGFLTAVWLMVTGLTLASISFFKPPSMQFFGYGLDLSVFMGVFLCGWLLLLIRSGRLRLGKKK